MATKTCSTIMSEISKKLKEHGWSLHAKAKGFLPSPQTSDTFPDHNDLVDTDGENETLIFGFETADDETISPLVVTSNGNVVQVFLSEMIQRTYGRDTACYTGLGTISTEAKAIERLIEVIIGRIPNSRIWLIEEDDDERAYYYDMLERF